MSQSIPLLRRSFLLGCAALCTDWSMAESSSTKPLRIFVPYPPGGAVDAVARTLSTKLPARLNNRTIIIENKPGAAGNIATEAAARSAPDGANVIITSNNHTINPSLYRRTGYDVEKDFVPIAGIGESGFVILAHPSTGFNTLDDMVRAARANSRALTFGTGGNGHPAHLAVELLKSKANIVMQHVPYKGSGPLISDVVGGQIPIAVVSVAAAQSFVKNGQVKALAMTSARRWPGLPDVPTVAESGYPGFDYTGWIGMFAPTGTPAPMIAELERAIMAVVAEPETVKILYQQGILAAPTDSSKFAAAVAQDLVLNRQIIKNIGLQID